MNIGTGTFHDYRLRKQRWFTINTFGKRLRIVEIWFGNKYITIHR